MTDLLTIVVGDALMELRKLPEASVHCCVTSPPYWGLRDYQVKGQIGLEKSPDEYVAKMIEVFREVKRVLRNDGSLWLNLGDSYAGSGKGGNPSDSPWSGFMGNVNREEAAKASHPMIPSGLKPKDMVGIPWRVAFALQQPYSVPTCVKSEVDRAWLAAMFDGEGCIGIRRFDSYRAEKQQVYQDGFVVYSCVTNNDIELLEKCAEVTGLGRPVLKQSAGSTDKRSIVSRRDSFGWRLDGNSAVDIIRAVYPYLIAKRNQACIAYTLDGLNKNGHGSRSVPAEIQEKKRYLWGLIKACNQRQSVTLPDWILEPKPKIEPGWYLRSDIIWAKPNPMPESVTDRPTKSHEYLFLLSKNQRYFYDADAIKEQSTDPESLRPEGRNKRNGDAFTQSHAEDFARTRVGFSKLEGACYPLRNKRTVWTVPTAPYPEAHFATYPPDLIKPCILAGCPVGGIVLDPFGGSGTTGMVALELGRKAILIELNQKYADLARKRCDITPGLPLSV